MVSRKPRTSGTERAFQIIECFVELGEPATAYQVAKKLGAPLSTIYESMGLLERLNILTRMEDDGKFFLGPRVYMYGLAYSRTIDADNVYRREAQALARLSGENTQICVRDGDNVVVSVMMPGRDHYQLSLHTGGRMPLTWTASGWLLVGHLPSEERRAIFSRLPPTPSGQFGGDVDAMDRFCQEAWAKGYCYQEAETGYSVAVIASPVINIKGECVATISVALPKVEAESRQAELVRMTMSAAKRVEILLGWRNPTDTEIRGGLHQEEAAGS